MLRLHTVLLAFAILAVHRSAGADIAQPAPLPGGLAVVARLAGINEVVEPGRALTVLVRTLHATPPGINVEADARVERVLQAFGTVSTFETLLKHVQGEDGGVALSVTSDQNLRRRLNDLLQFVDLTLRERSGKFSVEPRNNREAAARAQTLMTFGVDLPSLADRLNRGETVRLQVRREDVPVPLSAETWSRLIFERTVDPKWLAAEIVTNRRAGLLAYGLLNVDDATGEYLATHPALVRRIYEEHASLFAGFSSGLQIRDGRVMTPGGPDAAAHWEWAADAKISQPDAFVAQILGSADGRLAYLYDLIAQLDGPHQTFAMGTWMADRKTQRERFKALLDAGMVVTEAWEPAQFPFLRPPYDAALLLSSVRVTPDGAPAGPASARLWRLALGAEDLPQQPAKDLRDINAEGSLDAAWLVEQAALFDPNDRARRLYQIAFGQRAFGDAAAADMPDVLTAIAAYPAYAPVFQALERAGIRSPRVYASVARRARAMTALTGRRAFVALAQYQGALALVARLSRVGAITPDRAEHLAMSLAALDHPDGRYRGTVVNWMSSEVLPALGDDGRGEISVLNAAAGLMTRREGTRVVWADREHEVWLSAAEGERLARIRRQQGGVTLDGILAIYNQVVSITGANVTLPNVGLAAKALAAMSPDWPARSKDATPQVPGVSPAKPGREVLTQVAGELSKLSKPDDVRKVARTIEPLAELLDESLAEYFLSLTYAFDHPEVATAQLPSMNPALEHDFGLAESGWLRDYQRWSEAREPTLPGAPWHISGSLFGLDLAAARYHMRAIAGTPKPGAGIDTPDGDAMVRSLARLDPYALRTGDLAALSRAIEAGRERVIGVTSQPELFDSLLTEMPIDRVRERAIRWDIAGAPDRVVSYFTLTELLRLGGASSPQTIDLWGAASLAGCPCSAMVGPSQAPSLAGRPEMRLMPLISASDLHLRVAQLLHEYKLPADLAKAILTLAVRDLIQQPAPQDADDWLTRVRRAQALSQERVAEHVSLLLGTRDQGLGSRAQGLASRDQ